MYNYGQYVRKSDDDKSVTEKSNGDQLAALKPLIEREGLAVVKTWKESKSARIPNTRPDYKALIQLIEEGKINAILCYHVNRLVRNMEEGGRLVQLFIDGKIKEIKTPHAIYTSGDNILPIVLEAAQATQYSIDLARRVGIGMDSKFEKGGCNYKVPQGYMNARSPLNLKVGIVTIDPQRYDLIRKAWDMFLTGAYTPVQVTKTLNEVWGYRTRPTKKLPSAPLGENYGYQMFSNPFYAGFVRQHGKLVKSNDFPAMVTLHEFRRAKELLNKQERQSPHVHDYPYTGLMVCAYCGKQVTGEKKKISTGVVWENYHCSDPKSHCTKKGMARDRVEERIVEELSNVTIDADLCEIALANIIRDLDSQTGKVQTLYNQQHRTLEELEKKLSNLADMWIAGLMRDEKLYQEKEAELTKERNELIIKAEECRQELEKMRANAVASSNYVVFARDNFVVSKDQRKREIAHALGIKYLFYGKEKKIELEIDPLLVEVVKYAREIEKSLELVESGYTKEKAGVLSPALSFGGP